MDNIIDNELNNNNMKLNHNHDEFTDILATANAVAFFSILYTIAICVVWEWAV